MKIKANGIQINYRIDGREGAPWVTMSNSLATTHRMWDPQIEAFSRLYRVLRYDKRGHGETEVTPGPYSFELLADDVLALLDALGITQTHFVGLSMGGMTGMTMALRKPSVLRTLVGADWRDRVRPGAATRAHADRIMELARTWPSGYVAHHYIRYLGDLSGGRALGAKARKLYGLDDDGVRFYRFDGIESPREFKEGYRRLLDTAPWSADERSRIVEEARTAFRLSEAMFLELDQAVGVAA